jgi:oligoendopeptidase F
MIQAATRYYADLGAAPDRLGIALDLTPRRGKDPVAFTDFVRHGRYERGVWRQGRFRVSASYRTGGLGNLYELMHELGHGLHIAAIRTRPAYGDWPDSDVLTEALADVLGVEAYEPLWQERYISAHAASADALRSRLAGTILDVAWALFEIRVYRDASADPSAVWADITSRYLGVAPHPELPWWAMRGQLVDAPGYMLNYALGAVVCEALRARVRELRGPDAFETPSPELYDWLSGRIYRHGLERPSRTLVEDFLGRVLTPEPLVDTISRTRTAE